MVNMIESAEEFVKLRLSEDPVEYRRAANEEALDSTWLEVIYAYPRMAGWVAHNKTVSELVMRRLSELRDSEVDMQLAMKRRTPPDILWRLAQSENESVRLTVALNPKSPRPVLELLANDEWERIRDVIQKKLVSP